jgi:hypothetical protein
MADDRDRASHTGSTADRARLKPFHGIGRRFHEADSYGLVLLLIVITYCVAATLSGSGSTHVWGASMVLVIQVATVWFALRTSRARRAVRLFADVVLVFAVVIAVAAAVLTEGNDPSLLVLICSALLYFIAPLSIMRDLVTRPKVDAETFLGAISAYLLLGMFFSFAYLVMADLQSTPFFGTSGPTTGSQTLFFSFTTLTTTGYGNYVPTESLGQSVAVLEMLIGQIFLATAIAKVITSWTPKRRAQTPDGDGNEGPQTNRD